MLEYVHRWHGQEQGLKTSEIDTSILHEILKHIQSGQDVDWNGALPKDVIDQIQIELDIRAWGMR